MEYQLSQPMLIGLNYLKRLGISTLLIDSYDELEKILFTISQKSRGKTVYVTGSHEHGSPEAQLLDEMAPHQGRYSCCGRLKTLEGKK